MSHSSLVKPPIDLTGQRFGALVVVCVADYTPGRGVHWLCRCDCGGSTSANTHNLRRGNNRSCGCRTIKAVSTRKGEGWITYAMCRIRGAAKCRDIEFALSWDDVRGIITRSCAYCGDPPPVKQESYALTKAWRGKAWNGIDRVDSSIGYVRSNCVPCCVVCNNAKRVMGFAEFRKWVLKTAAHLQDVADVHVLMEVFDEA